MDLRRSRSTFVYSCYIISMKRIVFLAALGIATLFVTGCSTTQSAKAEPLKAVYGADVDLTRYDTATVQRFEFPQHTLDQRDAGMMLTQRIAERLQTDFGPLFSQVRMGEPLRNPNEVIITGRVTEYEPGSKVGRLFGPGIAPAKFKAELVLKDGATGNPILIAPIDKLWAWGHSIGAAKGIEDMVEESTAAAANTIARAKGWNPPARASTR
jgi:hypothetical protein